MNHSHSKKGTTHPSEPLQQQGEEGISKAVMTASEHPIKDSIDWNEGSPHAASSLESATKGTKRKSRKDEHPSPVNTLTGADTSIDSDSTAGKSTGRWTISEHEAFVSGLSLYGREWKRVAQTIPTRTAAQVRSHAQKYFHHIEQQQQQRRHTLHLDQKMHLHRQNSGFDFNYVGRTHDTSSIPDSDMMALSDREDFQNFDTPRMLNTMSDSVRDQAVRIIANPSSVHAEVKCTLEQLKQRYQELQNRYVEIQRRNNSDSGSTNQDYLRPRNNSDPTDNRPTATVPSVYYPNRNNDEQMVIQVLQARLQQQSQPLHQQHDANSNSYNPSDYDGDIETDNDEMNM